MKLEEQTRKTEYAKALNRITELEIDVVKFNQNNNELRQELATKDKQIDKLNERIEELEAEREELDSTIAIPMPSSLTELMELETKLELDTNQITLL